MKEVNLENFIYFEVNTYNSPNLKYYISLFNIKKQNIKIKNTPIINNRDWSNYQKYIKQEFGEPNED